jgi:hypothetical protein
MLVSIFLKTGYLSVSVCVRLRQKNKIGSVYKKRFSPVALFTGMMTDCPGISCFFPDTVISRVAAAFLTIL